MITSPLTIGHANPLGAMCTADGINFSLYAEHATGVELLLFEAPSDTAPSHTFHLDPEVNRTYGYWHVYVAGLRSGQTYGYRVHGPYAPEQGLRYDASKVLIDPYTPAVIDDRYDRGAACRLGFDNVATCIKSVAVDLTAYDWEGDTPLRRPLSDAVIYEMHVRGFTQHPNSGLSDMTRGTYAGLIAKIPYLQSVGVTAVELMPVQQFDRYAAPAPRPNYWGYEPIAWFAPHRDYSSRRDPLGPLDEFRDMVKALHRAGIEVILDVVFNHTAEDDADGPTLSLRGLENGAYYLLEPGNLAAYVNDSGVGNTINGNETIARRMILDCLRSWVQHMHVDGFRFDLASVLSRDESGRPTSTAPVLWDIDTDPVLAGTKIIAEAWDAAGLYQVASFPGDRWAVWNGPYRDTVRQFIKSDTRMVRPLSDVLAGSPNIFHQPDRDPLRTINFVTAHDGFTLNDLVSYNDKHNEANGQNNADGSNQNYSWNCGVEGPTTDPTVETLRARQVRNTLTILLLSQGRPMMLMGDEVRRTQSGNNNAYCQDNPISWFDWDDVQRHADLFRFASTLLRFHQASNLFGDRRYWSEGGSAEVRWHGVHLNEPDWGDASHSLAYELAGPADGEHLHVMLNAYWEPLTFGLPEVAAPLEWRRLLDTALPPPDDISDPPAGLAESGGTYTVQARSAVVLVAREQARPIPSSCLPAREESVNA
ncbi:MAG: glycogen debranching protein GlgX [Anaerolineae bacterium]